MNVAPVPKGTNIFRASLGVLLRGGDSEYPTETISLGMSLWDVVPLASAAEFRRAISIELNSKKEENNFQANQTKQSFKDKKEEKEEEEEEEATTTDPQVKLLFVVFCVVCFSLLFLPSFLLLFLASLK